LTFIAKFEKPYPTFPARLAGYTQSPMLPVLAFLIPEHYMRQFHPDYAAEGFLDEMVAKYGVKDWKSLWFDRGPVASWWLNPDLPVLNAWVVTEPAPAPQVKMVRNPYYHAVDPEGNQLPYIDTITHDLFQDKETLNLWVVQGLIDMQQRHIDGAGNYTLFKENEEKGGYVLKKWIRPSNTGLAFNQNYPDPEYAKLFQDIRFREAMSVALNREEYVDIAKNGLAEPRQSSPVSGTEYFDPEFETKWTEYDPDRANTLLDEIGLSERDSDGFRLLPNGEKLALILTVDSKTTENPELIVAYWQDVGIKTVLNVVERSLLESMCANNEMMLHIEGFGGALIETGAGERYYTSVDTNDRNWAPMWARWYASGGERGEEPPADHPIREVWAAWDAANVAPSLEEAKALMKKMVAIHKENVWSIGIQGEEAQFYIVNKKMANVPEGLLNDDLLRNPGFAQPVQFFFKQ
jgi:peptide/nickel transport system substrate-binding protein